MGGRFGGLSGRAVLAAALALASVAVPPAALAQVNGTAPASVGSAQRRAILDALRPAVETRLGPDIEFVVRSIDIRGGWAVITADPQRRGGRAIDARRYFPADDLEFMDGITVTAVMRFQNGRWRHVQHAIGATDVWYCGGVMTGEVARRFGC